MCVCVFVHICMYIYAAACANYINNATEGPNSDEKHSSQSSPSLHLFHSHFASRRHHVAISLRFVLLLKAD